MSYTQQFPVLPHDFSQIKHAESVIAPKISGYGINAKLIKQKI